jgi:hypothetical protein
VQPRLDHEHDRFEWLRPDAAIGRCKPAAVADGIRLAESSITAEMAFLPLDAAEQKSLPLIAGDGEGSIHIAVVGGRDAGFFQHYQVTGGSALAVGLPDTVGIDCAIGGAELIGRGLGPQLIWSYVRDVVLPPHPGARHVVASPDATDVGSIRVLQQAGFAATREITVSETPGPQRLCVLDVAKFFGLEG